MPVQFHGTPKQGIVEDESCGLYDTGASDSFIDEKLVDKFGLEIEPHQAVVKNGDGTRQISQGYVWITISIGMAFKIRYRFRVIKLDRCAENCSAVELHAYSHSSVTKRA